MYKNLKAEMIRQDIKVIDISNILGIEPATAQKKINGKIGISLLDCQKIASLFRENNAVDFLFKNF